MKRTDPQSVAEVLSEVLAQTDASQRLAEIRAAESWPAVVGPHLASQTGKPFVRDGVLSVRIPSAALRSELSMNASALVREINRVNGAPADRPIVTSIKFLA